MHRPFPAGVIIINTHHRAARIVCRHQYCSADRSSRILRSHELIVPAALERRDCFCFSCVRLSSGYTHDHPNYARLIKYTQYVHAYTGVVHAHTIHTKINPHLADRAVPQHTGPQRFNAKASTRSHCVHSIYPPICISIETHGCHSTLSCVHNGVAAVAVAGMQFNTKYALLAQFYARIFRIHFVW